MQGSSSSSDPITDINITPLVDVSLVLVIIFMITMPFLVEKSMKVASSAQKVVEVSSADEPVLVELKSGGLTLEGRPVETAELADELKKVLGERGTDAVSVSVEKQIKHGQVVQVLDEVMASGAKNLNLVDPEDGQNGGV